MSIGAGMFPTDISLRKMEMSSPVKRRLNDQVENLSSQGMSFNNNGVEVGGLCLK